MNDSDEESEISEHFEESIASDSYSNDGYYYASLSPAKPAATISKSPSTPAMEADYSSDFSEFDDEKENNETIYSQQFESAMYSQQFESAMSMSAIKAPKEGISAITPILKPTRNNKMGANNASVEFTQNNVKLPEMPSVDAQALHAESVVAELSKEVVRLRNQHRGVLKDRRKALVEKKARADQRRLAYKEELDGALSRQVELEAIADETRSSLDVATEKMSASEQIIEDLQQKLAAAGRVFEEKEKENDRLTTRIEKVEMDALNKQKLFDEAKQMWMEERQCLQQDLESLRAHSTMEVERATTQVALMQKTMEANEASFKREKEFLPIFKSNFDVEIAQERALLQQQYERLRQDLEMREMKVTLTSSEFANRELELKQVAAAQQQEKELLQQQRVELETSIRMMGPNLRSSVSDMEQSRKTKQQTEDLHRQCEEKMELVLAAEKQVHLHDADLTKRELELETKYQWVLKEKQGMSSSLNQIQYKQQQLNTEKFKLYQCSMELSRQMNVLQQGVKTLAVFPKADIGGVGGHTGGSTTSSILSGTGKLSASMNQVPNAHTDGQPLAMVHMLQSLERASISLNTLTETLCSVPRAAPTDESLHHAMHVDRLLTLPLTAKSATPINETDNVNIRSRISTSRNFRDIEKTNEVDVESTPYGSALQPTLSELNLSGDFNGAGVPVASGVVASAKLVTSLQDASRSADDLKAVAMKFMI